MPSPSEQKLTRVNIRVSEQEKDTITRAAAALNTTLSRFMVQRAYVDAQAVLADGSHFQLARDQWEAFCRELDAPVKDLPTLRRLLTEPGVFDD